MNDNTGFVRVGAATPALTLADPERNANDIITIIRQAELDHVGITVFPELCLTGRTCGDLYYQDMLYEAQLNALGLVRDATAASDIVVVLGMMLKTGGSLYNCAAVIQRGEIKGIVPKMYAPLPDSKPFTDMFVPGSIACDEMDCVRLFGETVPFGRLTFEDEQADLKIGIEIGDDMQRPSPAAADLILSGADIICNTGSAQELAGSCAARRNMIKDFTDRSCAGYIFASAGIGESVADAVFGGHSIIADQGDILMESDRYQTENHITYSEIDFAAIGYVRSHRKNFKGDAAGSGRPVRKVALSPVTTPSKGERLMRKYPQLPFIPTESHLRDERCDEIFDIQVNALARRIVHTHAKKIVIGISGGLDSTLAMLVCAKAMELLGRPASDTVAVTMPGFGTTDSTYHNALTLMRKLGTDTREISIADSVRLHFRDIGHDEAVKDVTYENSQARERTQILMDLANDEGGFVVGTGDLSESALGWCTFNGDHISMYNVNCDIPKTLIRHVVARYMEKIDDDDILKITLKRILDTPISPELLPPDESGNIAQKTEDSIGPYELHDFFIYHTIRSGMSPERLVYVAAQAFEGTFDEDFIRKYLATFYRRFFSQQFKRNCVPDGPKIGSICLSPRGAFSMPSDAGSGAWLSAFDHE